MTQYFDGHNGVRAFDPVHTGFEIPLATMNFNVIRSWAQIPVTSTIHVVDMANSGVCPNGEEICDIPSQNLELKSYNITNPDFIDAWGSTPDSSFWPEIFASDTGADAWDSIGMFENNSSVSIRLPEAHDTMLIAKYTDDSSGENLYFGVVRSESSFLDRGDGVRIADEWGFKITKYINPDGSIIYPPLGTVSGYVYDETSEPQANVRICLEDFYTGYDASCEWTGEIGEYVFTNVPYGKYIFRVKDLVHPQQWSPGTQDRLLAYQIEVMLNLTEYSFSTGEFLEYGDPNLPAIYYLPQQENIWVLLPSNEADAHVIIQQGNSVLYDLGIQPNIANEYGDYMAIFDTNNMVFPDGATIDVIKDGETIASLLVNSDFSLQSVDYEHDTVTGYAIPYSSIAVNTQDPWGNRRPLADENGVWVADFSRVIEAGVIGGNGVIIDLTPEMLGSVMQMDSDGDAIYILINDADGDEIPDISDNSPNTPNHDQLDSDFDSIPDVDDACPDDDANLCDPNASSSKSINYYGGSLETPDGSVKLEIPAGALDAATSLGITAMESPDTIQIGTDLIDVVSSFSITPHGTTFSVPVTLTLKWSGVADADEPELRLYKDGNLLAGPCQSDARCDMLANTFTVSLDSLSYFILGYPSNKPPVAISITAPLDPVSINTTVNTAFVFSDPDSNDTHSVTWNWGDGSTSSGILSSSGLSASGQHIYTKPGVYSVTATVKDGAGETASLTYNYIVVFDPASGFITGGGWAIAPAGSIISNPTISGKLNFGVDSKYHNFALFPSGNTKFEFKAANLNFVSTSYLWMIVDGAQAQYRGSGAINGSGDYAFLVTVIDGKLVGNTRIDLIRVKIWNKSTGEVILDTQPGAPDNAEPTLAIGGGSITIHK
jgi:hypothetical protein